MNRNAFNRNLSCAKCGKLKPQSAHIRTGTFGGMGIKPNDKWTVPLCDTCHREQHQIGETRFWGDVGQARNLARNLSILHEMSALNDAHIIVNRFRRNHFIKATSHQTIVPKAERLWQIYGQWLKIISDHTGYMRDEMHTILQDMFFDKSRKKFAAIEYMESIEAWAQEQGLRLPYPQDFAYALNRHTQDKHSKQVKGDNIDPCGNDLSLSPDGLAQNMNPIHMASPSPKQQIHTNKNP